jgi:hypothetical protein
MYRFSIDIADWNGLALRRVLRSAERFSDLAILSGSLYVKTPFWRSSALLRSVTRCDHRRGGGRVGAVAFRFAILHPRRLKN